MSETISEAKIEKSKSVWGQQSEDIEKTSGHSGASSLKMLISDLF